MARSKKETVKVEVQDSTNTDTDKVVDTILDKLSKKIDIPDDKPVDVALRNQAVLHLLAGAGLHRLGYQAVEHRIKNCIDIANTVVKLLGDEE